jgi:hypothetical protein
MQYIFETVCFLCSVYVYLCDCVYEVWFLCVYLESRDQRSLDLRNGACVVLMFLCTPCVYDNLFVYVHMAN